ncbi:hypothetical protein K9M59_04500 [Candidatus Gracilibacteria bacterium]|nr:hypothetical protein [Candidatus Gracilibacteria bacterium]MCF7819580.1 hypothetical protein [Candidatus Gracilibacteria bacterium]
MHRSSFRIRSLRTWLITGGMLLGIVFFGILYHRFFLDHSQSVPTEGGIFTGSTIGAIKNLNPLASDQSLFDQDLSELLFEGLLQYNPSSGQIEDALAQVRISEDSKTYFLTLKKSARFQDGQPVTIEDVRFTFEKVIQNPVFENSVLRDAFEYVSLEVVDKNTLAFVLPEQNIFFLSLLTTPILPARYFEGALIEEITDPDFPFNKKPIGAGPYQLKNIVPNDDGSFRVFLQKNKYYFSGEPYIDQLVFYVYPTFEHLNVTHPWSTMFSKIPFVFLESFEKKLFEQYHLESQYQKREYLLPRFTAIFFNLDKPIVNKPAIRKALRLALEKEKILKKEKGWNKIDSFFFFEGIESWHQPDFAEAQRTLRDGGFPYDSEQEVRVVAPENTPVEITFITSTSPPVYSRFAQSMVRTWEKELNIHINLQVLDPPEFQQALAERQYDMVFFGQNFSKNFDSLSTWHSSQTGGFNLANLTHEEVDFLIDEVRFSGAQSDLFALNSKLEDIRPAIILSTPKYNLLVSEELKGFSENFGKIRSHSQRFSGIEKWYFEEKLDWDWPSGKSKFWGFWQWFFGVDEAESKEINE